MGSLDAPAFDESAVDGRGATEPGENCAAKSRQTIPFILPSFSILAGVQLKTEFTSQQQVYIYSQNRLCQRLTKARGIIGCVSILLGLLSFYYYYFICSPKPMMANTFFD